MRFFGVSRRSFDSCCDHHHHHGCGCAKLAEIESLDAEDGLAKWFAKKLVTGFVAARQTFQSFVRGFGDGRALADNRNWDAVQRDVFGGAVDHFDHIHKQRAATAASTTTTTTTTPTIIDVATVKSSQTDATLRDVLLRIEQQEAFILHQQALLQRNAAMLDALSRQNAPNAASTLTITSTTLSTTDLAALATTPAVTSSTPTTTATTTTTAAATTTTTTKSKTKSKTNSTSATNDENAVRETFGGYTFFTKQKEED